MHTAIEALAGVHMLVAAALLVGWVLHRTRGSGLTLFVWSARVQLLLGLVLVGLNEAGGESLDNAKIAVKLLVALGVVACAEIASARARRGEPTAPLVDIGGALVVVNILVAFLWR